MARLSFRQHMLQAREEAIVVAVCRLLAEKGFDLMTVDEVAADAGIAKASLYKHFASKEALAAAAMVRLLQQALACIESQAARPEATARQRLEAVIRWAVQLQLDGRMPTLPAQNSSLRHALLANKAYLDLLLQASDALGGWIVRAQADGVIDTMLPPELVLFTVFARACDPVPVFLQAGGAYSDAQIVDWVVQLCFDGLRGAAGSKAGA